jgi:hypothetical protein
MADFKPLNIYGHRTYAMKPAAKITTMTGRISTMEITQIRHTGGRGITSGRDPEGRIQNPQGQEKIAVMDEGSGAAQYRRSK